MGGALIFDFDGVIADSEAIANTVLAEIVTDLGHSTTLEQSLARYAGRRWDECMAEIEAAIGKPLPSTWYVQCESHTRPCFEMNTPMSVAMMTCDTGKTRPSRLTTCSSKAKQLACKARRR